MHSASIVNTLHLDDPALYQNKLETIEARRLHGVLIEGFKILKGIDDAHWKYFFTRADLSTQGYDSKEVK